MSDTKFPIAASNPATENTGSTSAKIMANSKEVLLQYTHCSACKARLHFSYVTDFSRNLTQETARCPECHLQAHRMMHRLQ